MVLVLRDILVPRHFVGLLGRLLSVLSVLALAQQAFSIGFVEAISSVLDYYDALVQLLLGWAQAPAAAAMRELGRLFHVSVVLDPQWKHVFLLVWVYFVRDALNDYEMGFRSSGFVLAVWALVCATAISLAVGAAGSGIGFWPAFVTVAIPIAGAFIFTLVRRLWHATFIRSSDTEVASIAPISWRESVSQTLQRATNRSLVGIGIAVVALNLTVVHRLRAPGLAVLAFLIILLALYWLWLGSTRVRANQRADESWQATYQRLSSTKLGIAMLGVFFWASVFLVTNAGLQRLGV